MADNKGPPKAFWAVVIVLLGGCCGVTSLLFVAAPRFGEWAQRETFIQGMRLSMDLPAADEERLATLAYQAMMETGGMRTYEANELGRPAAEGARRADDRTMLELHEMRTALARASPPLCASMWTGAGDPSAVYAVLAGQPDDVVISFYSVTYGLLDAAAAAAPVVMTPEEISSETNAAFAAATASRSPSAIATALEMGDAVDQNQACGAMLELYDFIRAQPEPARSRYARALFCSVSPAE